MVLLDKLLSRERCVEIFRNFDLDPDIRHRAKTAAMAYVMVSNGTGFAILSVQEAKTGPVCLPIRDSIQMPVYWRAYPEELQLSPVAQRLLTAAKNVADWGGLEEI